MYLCTNLRFLFIHKNVQEGNVPNWTQLDIYGLTNKVELFV